ncbi:DUF1281 domain-containing protein [Escherichia coli]
MYFSGEPAKIAEIKRLASGAVTPLYRRATNEGIQLFLAGSAGLLQTTEDVRFEPCPGLTAAGRGVVSPENIAFTRWLTLLQDSVLLDEQNCLMLHELWLQSGTGQRRWEGLPDDARETITVHFTAKRGDWCDIWGNHYQNRLIYERAMLDESGGVVTRTQDFEPGGQVFSRGEWLTIIRVNKSNGAVSSVTTPNYSFLGYSGTMKVTPDRITDYKAPSAEEAAVASQAAKRPPVVNYPGEGFREMTKAQWAALPRDCKAVRSVAEAEDHGAYRYRRTMGNNFRLVNVYITDMKITEIPQK